MKKLFLLSALCCSLAWAADDQPELAKKLNDQVIAQMAKFTDEKGTGENFAWPVSYSFHGIMQGCKNWPTDTWMESTEKSLNALADKMVKGPDGYKGFVGPYEYNNAIWCDVHVSDAILIEHMLVFAEIVHDNPALKEKYGASAKRFVEIAKKDLIEKWAKRGTFCVDGPFAGYPEWNMYCKPGEITKWYKDDRGRGEERGQLPCVPFNKAMDIGLCMLQVYRITGEEIYRNDAEKIFNRLKASINRIDGGCTWNYWEPVAPSDIVDLKNPNHRILTHWVDTHPYRNYQLGELSKIIYAYDMGVTFTEEDMKRFVETNLRFMWNGDKEDPKYVNSTSKMPGYKQAEPSAAYPNWAGCCWGLLGQFDPTIRELAAKNVKANDIIAKTAFDKACATPASYERKYAPKAPVGDFAWMKDIKESKGQMFAIVLPSVVEKDKTTVILSKANAPRSEAKIFVRPLAGGDRSLIKTIPKMGDGEQFAYEWDGTIEGKRTPGEYVIIWEYMDGERAYPVTLK